MNRSESIIKMRTFVKHDTQGEPNVIKRSDSDFVAVALRQWIFRSFRIQRRDSPRLALEAFTEVFVRDPDGDGAVKPRVASLINFTSFGRFTPTYRSGPGWCAAAGLPISAEIPANVAV